MHFPLHYPEDLPIAQKRADIAEAIARHQVVIVAGETGSGKTTQLPKICLELGRGEAGMIGHTQPRRLAARTVAARIAEELGVEPGELVGYQVRFTDKVSENTRVKLMTDGILLNEMQRDRLLRRYDTLIIDEAHERSLNVDFLLGYLKRILPQRPDLKLIVTSATIDVQSFSRYFDDAPVIEVSGRGYPVETHYLQAVEEEARARQVASLVEDIEAGVHGERGDVLVFLPGEREIREQARAMKTLERVEVLPLYARLSQAEQNRVFTTGSSRKGIRAVLATNVAETSLTVPGIRYVIDPGTARISRYSHRSKLQRLPVEAISQASADQRRGRCGRVGPGVCFRLYTEEDFNARPEYTAPEIQRTNLASVVLQMLTLGLGDVEAFPFIDPPDRRLVRDGFKVLEELGAVTAAGKLTKTGRRMARLPVDPRVARMVIEASRQDCLELVLVIASALSVQDPRERPAEKQQQADQQHARFKHERSDFMAWLALWRHYEEQRQALSQNQLRKLCKREYLSYLRLREWRDVHRQLTIACRQQKLAVQQELPEEESYEGVHRSLLAGLLSNIAQQHEGREYLGSRNRKLSIFPGSSQARRSPPWLVAAEIVETSRVYARQVAQIDPRWALDINPALLKRHYYEPRWRARTGQAVAYERVTLFGLTLADKQVVHFGPINTAESRELMIREGLVAGNYNRHPKFLKHNLRLVRDIEGLEARTRRRDLLAGEQVLFEFYDQRLPHDICTSRGLESWLSKHPRDEENLYMSRDVLLAASPGGDVDAQFPPALDWQGTRFKLSYAFQPGNEGDGVSITVPVALLNRAPRFLFDWLVPGLLREKCVALVKALPKEKRKRLVPAPDYVDRALAELQPSDDDLLEALAARLSRLGNVALTRADWGDVQLDDYYLMNIRVVDAQGKLLAQGRDLHALIERFRADTQQSVSSAVPESPAREGLTRWDFEALPERFTFRQAGVDIVSWPALEDRGESVAVVLCDYAWEANRRHRLGVLRLLGIACREQVRYLRKQAFSDNAGKLLLASCGLQRETIVADLHDAALLQSAGLEDALPRERAGFDACLARCRGQAVERALELETQLTEALGALSEAKRMLSAQDAGGWPDSRADIEGQLQSLLQDGFMRDTPAQWLERYPRYLRAVLQRVERLSGQYPKDQKYTAMMADLLQPLQAQMQQRPELLARSAEACTYRWMLEEFRISLFAQNLGTRMPISQKRLQAQWALVEAWLHNNPA
ncbi:MAG: ATP-dependent RNA helicase HrpA [Halioglobus sp.]